jgi:hypothetical protein
MYGQVGTPFWASGIPARRTFTTYETRISQPVVVVRITQLQLHRLQQLQQLVLACEDVAPRITELQLQLFQHLQLFGRFAFAALARP